MKSKQALLTAHDVRRMLDYDPLTGELIWRVERYRKHPGDIAGCKYVTSRKKHRTVSVSINYRRYLANRLVWLWVTGKWPKNEIDHIDGNGWNNRWNNLREATHSQNCKNMKLKITNTSGVQGVMYDERRHKYRARITVNGREIWLGYFKTLNAAAKVRNAAALKYHGEFAKMAQIDA